MDEGSTFQYPSYCTGLVKIVVRTCGKIEDWLKFDQPTIKTETLAKSHR